MKQLFIFLLLAGLILACGNASDTSKTAGAKLSNTGNVTAANGEKIYQLNCITCHGLYGDMGAGGAANLAKSKLPLEERVAVITNGRNAMTSFKALLSKEKIKAVAQYTMELSKRE